MQPYHVLQAVFGYEHFRGAQLAIIERVLAGKHALVIMPTGGGKSLCYQIPALVLAARNAEVTAAADLTLVISPLIALMKDQVDVLQARGVSADFINSSLRRNERERRYAEVADGKFDLLYVTPERFRKPDFLAALESRHVVLLAVDEAHCISEWGHDFRPDYTRLTEIRKILGAPPTLALTATATPDVQQDIIQQLGLEKDEVQVFHQGIDRPNLTLKVRSVWGVDEKLEEILALRQRFAGSGIVYFSLIRSLEEMSDRLLAQRIPHLVYHGDLATESRRKTQEQFMNNPNHLVLATNAFGMGIDKEDIRFVLHAEIPGSMESYYQEIGRAGRDGQPAECILLYEEADLATQMEFLRWSNPDAEFCHRVHDLLLHQAEQIAAFGQEWIREQLHFKQRHDFRLETVLSLFDRYGTIEGSLHPLRIERVHPLPAALSDPRRREEKILRDQKKLYALIEYINQRGDRKAFIHEYFGLPYNPKLAEQATD